jgi:acetyltransferase-like isoleucine patch superfamily enzyme
MVNSELHIYGDVSLYPGSCIDIENGKVSIGGNTILNPNTRIMCKKEVQIGSDCLFAVDVIVRDDDGHAIGTDGQTPVYRIAPVKIGNKCWIGQGASVLKGVEIADGCIVAAGAVVSKDVEASTLVGGIPAQRIYANVTWNP